MKNRKKIDSLKYSLFVLPAVLCLILFAACYYPLDMLHDDSKPVNTPPGMGYFTLILDRQEMRSTMPASDLSHFAVFYLEFFPAGTDFNATLPTPLVTHTAPNTNTSISFLIPVGTYALRVSAYLGYDSINDIRGSLVAQGFSSNVQIVQGTNVAVDINLEPIISAGGTGTFAWNITLPAGLSSATMRLQHRVDNAWVDFHTVPFDLLNIGNLVGVDDLPAGFYRALIELVKPNSPTLLRREIIHIYDHLISILTLTFTDDHLSNLGTEDNPFRVNNLTDLLYVGREGYLDGVLNNDYLNWGLDKHYILMTNITLTPPAAGESNWTPIGTNIAPFIGTFDGDGHTISNLTVFNFSGSRGMFGVIDTGGAIRNLGLRNVTVGSSFGSNSGSIAGTNNGLIEDCFAAGGTISGGANSIGGIVGLNTGTVRNCIALNQSVTGGAGAIGRRVAGFNFNNGTLINNHAFSGMTIDGNAMVTSADADSLHGANITTSNISGLQTRLNDIFGTNAPDLNDYLIAYTVTVFNGTTTTGFDNLEAALDSVSLMFREDFIVTLYADQEISTQIGIVEQGITLVGADSRRTIRYNNPVSYLSAMFYVTDGAEFTLDDNITLEGNENNIAVAMEGATFIMLPGSIITGFGEIGAVNGGWGTFIMTGGEIINNNSKHPSINIAGGLTGFTQLTMSGGKIINNTRLDTIPSDVHVYGSLTLSGDAEIGFLTLRNWAGTNYGSVTIGANFTREVEELNLHSQIATISDVISWWEGRQVLQRADGLALTPADIAKFPLGDFISDTNQRQAISDTHYIDNAGFLRVIPSVTVSVGGTTTTYGSLTSALDSITTAGNYTVTLLEDQEITATRTFDVVGANITLTGGSEMRTITHNAGAANDMFDLSNNTNVNLTLGNNITLKGRTGATEGAGNIIRMGVGTFFYMQAGSRIIGHTAGGLGAAVRMSIGGTFNMADGSSITGHNSNSSSAAVVLNSTYATFNMNGGSITGNRNTAAATTTNVSAGVSVFLGTFNMNGGEITGNTRGPDNNQIPADVYIGATSLDAASRVPTLNNNAQIGTLTLNAQTPTVNSRINIGDNFTGSVQTLDLRTNNTDLATSINLWDGKTVLQGTEVAPDQRRNLTPQDIAKFGLGDFVTSENVRQPISPTHTIGTSASNIGVLINAPLGTAQNPFRASTETQLRQIGRGTGDFSGWTLSAHYILTENIVLTSNWTPIPGFFRGTFNGGGHTITGLSFTLTTGDDVGMFELIGPNGVVENLGLINVNITGRTWVGAIVGDNQGTIRNCFVTGNITGRNHVGGLVGYNMGLIENSYYGSGTVSSNVFTGTTNGNRVGGIVGSNVGDQNVDGATAIGIIQNCYVVGAVTGNGDVGGIAGFNDGIVQNCYVVGGVSAAIANNLFGAGGIVGDNAVEAPFTGVTRNNVALNLNITAGAGTNIGRVIGLNTAVRANNYARSDMLINGALVTTGIGLATNHGENITSANFSNQIWWTTTGNWLATGGAFAWDFSSTGPWMWGANGLPVLRGMPGAAVQNHTVQ